MELLHFAFYFALLIFIILVVSKIVRIATAPVHLRWELYPVPHEKNKADYGGSYFEDYEWWNKPQEKDFLNELWTMFKEIVFLKGVWEHNRSLWFGSFPFHFALYLYICTTLLTLLGLIFIGEPSSYPIEGDVFFGIVEGLSWASAILGIVGAIVLLGKRIFDSNLSLYSNPSHYFNIVLIGALYLTLLLWLISGNAVLHLVSFYYGVFSFSAFPRFSVSGYIHLYLLSFFLFYLPFTHMTHFFAKYFTYHKVRWDDEPNFAGTELRKKIEKQLNFPVRWSAPHIGTDGKSTWLVIASSLPTKEKKNG